MKQSHSSRPLAMRMLSGTVLASILSGMPVFLLAAQAVLVARDIPFDERQLGLAATVFFGVGAVASLPAGQLGERVGAKTAMVIGAWGSMLALLGMAFFARTWMTVLGLMVVAGLANSVTQPATNLALAAVIPVRRQGVAFGLKQAAMPGASMLAGVAVPVIGLTLGWRSGFAFAAGLGLVVTAVLPHYQPASIQGEERSQQARTGRLPLLLLALAGMGAAGSAACLVAFAVLSLTARGMPVSTAGIVYAAGGVVAILTRVVAGLMADRRTGGHLLVIAVMLFLGACGYALLAFGGPGLAASIGTILGFGAGWGWAGLFNYAIVRYYPHAPGRATGVTQTGVLVGGMLGPLLFGTAVVRWSYGVAWAAVALTAFAAAMLAAGLRPMLARDLERRGWNRFDHTVQSR